MSYKSFFLLLPHSNAYRNFWTSFNSRYLQHSHQSYLDQRKSIWRARNVGWRILQRCPAQVKFYFHRVSTKWHEWVESGFTLMNGNYSTENIFKKCYLEGERRYISYTEKYVGPSLKKFCRNTRRQPQEKILLIFRPSVWSIALIYRATEKNYILNKLFWINYFESLVRHDIESARIENKIFIWSYDFPFGRCREWRWNRGRCQFRKIVSDW